MLIIFLIFFNYFGKLVAAVSVPECGLRDWYTSKVISLNDLNVSNPDQTCPTNW